MKNSDIINIIFVVVSSLLSGLIGIIITNRLHFKHEKSKFKRDICLQLIANRHDLRGDLFTQALNSIIFAFNDDKNTIDKFIIFNDGVMSRDNLGESNRKLLELIKAMLKHLNMEVQDIDEKYYLISFNIRVPLV